MRQSCQLLLWLLVKQATGHAATSCPPPLIRMQQHYRWPAIQGQQPAQQVLIRPALQRVEAHKLVVVCCTERLTRMNPVGAQASVLRSAVSGSGGGSRTKQQQQQLQQQYHQAAPVYSSTTRSALLPTSASTQGAAKPLLDAGSPRLTTSMVLRGAGRWGNLGLRLSAAPSKWLRVAAATC